MVLAPRFQVRDVFLVQFDIHKFPAGLIAEPAAHPRREITRLCRRHSQILVASNCAHIDGDLRICSRRKKRDCKRCTNQSKPHFVAPFRCHQAVGRSDTPMSPLTPICRRIVAASGSANFDLNQCGMWSCRCHTKHRPFRGLRMGRLSRESAGRLSLLAAATIILLYFLFAHIR